MERESGWVEVRGALAFVLFGWLAFTLATVFLALYQAVSLSFEAVALAGLGITIAGLARLVRAPREARIGPLVAGAIAGFALAAAIKLFLMVVVMLRLAGDSGAPLMMTPRVWQAMAVILNVALGGGVILIVLILYTVARRVQALLPFWFGVTVSGAVGFDVLLSLYRLVAGASFRVPSESPWLWLFVTVGTLVAQNALLLLLIANTRRTLAGGGAAQAEADWEGAAGWFGAPEWQRPTRGVGLYAGAVKALLLVIFGGYGAILTARLMGLPLLAVITAIGIPIGVLIAQVIMIIGLAGYATVPAKSGARELALAALAAHALAVLLDVASIIAIISAATGDTDYAYDAQRAVARAQLISGAGQAVGLTGFVLLLLSFSRVARFVGAGDQARKATPILIMVIVTAAAILLVRVVLNSPRVVDTAGAGLLALAAGVVFLALTSLLMYMSFVNRLHAVLVEGPPG